MANPAMQVYRDFTDSAQQPLTGLIGTAQLQGGNQYLLTGTSEFQQPLAIPAVTSTGAQASGPGAPTLLARTTGGAMHDGAYDYLVTYWDGSESLVGVVASTTIATSGANTGSVVVTMPSLPSSAIRAFVYRQKDVSGTYYRVWQSDDLSVTTWIDTQVESSVTSNPSPAGSAEPAGRMVFLLTAPAGLSDPTNGSAIINYVITIGDTTYYTSTFAYSSTPVELGTVLGTPPTPGELVRIYWTDGDPAQGPLAGRIAQFNISQDCTTLDSGINLFAQEPILTDPSDSQGGGFVWLTPQSNTTAPGSFYYGKLVSNFSPGSQTFTFQAPDPDPMGHPNGFALSSLTLTLVGPPNALIANTHNIRADTSEPDGAQTIPLASGSDLEASLQHIRNRIGNVKGLGTGHWADDWAAVELSPAAQQTGNFNLSGNGTLGGALTVTGALAGQSLTINGVTGANTLGRLIGRHDGGAPTTGAHNAGDWVIDFTTPTIWYCTVSGTPGVWIQNAGTGGGSLSLHVATVGSLVNTPMTSIDDVFFVFATGGNRTITLPDPASTHKPLWIIRADTTPNRTVTIQGHAGELINGIASYVLKTYFHAAQLIADGVNWYVVGNADAYGNSNLLAAKGLIPVGTGLGTVPVTLGPPADGQTLIGDSTQASGWKLGFPSSGGAGGGGGGILDYTRHEGGMLYRHLARTTSLVLGVIGDDVSTGNGSTTTFTNAVVNNNLALMLPNITFTVSNQAVNGSTTAQWVSGSTNLVAAKAAFATAGVWLIFVNIGANDAAASVSAATWQSNMISMLNDLVSSGYIVIVNQLIGATTGSSYFTVFQQAYNGKLANLCNGGTKRLGDTGLAGQFQANSGSWFQANGAFPNVTGMLQIGTAWAAAALSTINALTEEQTLKELAVGTSGQVLGSNGTDPLWVNPTGALLSNQLGSYSASAQPTIPVAATSLIDQFRGGYHSPDLWDTSTGYREFDLAYYNGVYYLAYDNGTQVVLKHASTIAGLQAASTDQTLSLRYPSIYFDGSLWHVWALNVGAQLTQHYTCATFGGTYALVDSAIGVYNDIQVRQNPSDGLWYTSYNDRLDQDAVSNFVNYGRLGMLRASSPNGPWTDLGYVFSAIGVPPWAPPSQSNPSGQFDGTVVFWNGRMYILFCATDANFVFRIAIVEVDPSNSCKAVGPATVLVESLETWQQTFSTKGVANPIFLAVPTQPGQERIYYSQKPASVTNDGWGYIQVGPPPPDGRRPQDMLRLNTAVGLDIAGGMQATNHGGAVFSGSGIACNATPSGAYGYLAGASLTDFTLAITFTLQAIPGSDGLLVRASPFSMGSNQVALWVTSGAVLRGRIIGSTTLTLTGSTVLSTGVTYRAILRRLGSEVRLYLGLHQEASGTQADALTGMAEWSIANDKGATQTAGEQLSCTVFGAVLTGEALPLSADPFEGLPLGAGGGGGGATSLAALSDVSESSPAANDVLTYNGSAWTNQTTQARTHLSKGGGSVGTEPIVNLIEGGGIAITAADNSGATRLDVTLRNTYASVPLTVAGGASPTFVTTAGGDLVACVLVI